MDSTEIGVARNALRNREGIPQKHETCHIGTWSNGQSPPTVIPELAEWARAQGVQHVVWTNLPPKFNGTEITPSAEQVVQYLSRLTGARRDNAERYIRFAPKQIDTAYRRCIEVALHWSARDVSY
jgi:hypothetical protein